MHQLIKDKIILILKARIDIEQASFCPWYPYHLSLLRHPERGEVGGRLSTRGTDKFEQFVQEAPDLFVCMNKLWL